MSNRPLGVVLALAVLGQTGCAIGFRGEAGRPLCSPALVVPPDSMIYVVDQATIDKTIRARAPEQNELVMQIQRWVDEYRLNPDKDRSNSSIIPDRCLASGFRRHPP